MLERLHLLQFYHCNLRETISLIRGFLIFVIAIIVVIGEANRVINGRNRYTGCGDTRNGDGIQRVSCHIEGVRVGVPLIAAVDVSHTVESPSKKLNGAFKSGVQLQSLTELYPAGSKAS